jgi:hypothetical protein
LVADLVAIFQAWVTMVDQVVVVQEQPKLAALEHQAKVTTVVLGSLFPMVAVVVVVPEQLAVMLAHQAQEMVEQV